jgi:heme/copper-type cytochrome/quinol oxidase subunit 4
VALIASGVSLFNDMCRKPETGMESLVDQTIHEVERQIAASDNSGGAAADQKIHMDLTSETGHLPLNVIVTRAARFFGYLLVFMGIMAVIGLIPTIGLFVVFFMRYENSERWPLVITYATVLVIAVTFVFEHIMHIPWPPTFLGQWFPELKAFVPSLS